MATLSRTKQLLFMYFYLEGGGGGGINYTFKFPVYPEIKMLIASYVSIFEFHCFKLCSNFPIYQNQSNEKSRISVQT